MLKNAFKKHPLQNRTNVQIKGGGGAKAFWTMFKKTALFLQDGIPNKKGDDDGRWWIMVSEVPLTKFGGDHS